MQSITTAQDFQTGPARSLMLVYGSNEVGIRDQIIMLHRAPDLRLGPGSLPGLRGRVLDPGARCRGRLRTNCLWGRRVGGERCRMLGSCR